MKLNRIKVVLSEKGISQTWLAKKLDKSFSMVNAYACNWIKVLAWSMRMLVTESSLIWKPYSKLLKFFKLT